MFTYGKGRGEDNSLLYFKERVRSYKKFVSGPKPTNLPAPIVAVEVFGRAPAFEFQLCHFLTMYFNL